MHTSTIQNHAGPAANKLGTQNEAPSAPSLSRLSLFNTMAAMLSDKSVKNLRATVRYPKGKARWGRNDVHVQTSGINLVSYTPQEVEIIAHGFLVGDDYRLPCYHVPHRETCEVCVMDTPYSDFFVSTIFNEKHKAYPTQESGVAFDHINHAGIKVRVEMYPKNDDRRRSMETYMKKLGTLDKNKIVKTCSRLLILNIFIGLFSKKLKITRRRESPVGIHSQKWENIELVKITGTPEFVFLSFHDPASPRHWRPLSWGEVDEVCPQPNMPVGKWGTLVHRTTDGRVRFSLRDHGWPVRMEIAPM